MCLAVPGEVIEVRQDDALVDFQGNRQYVATTLVPDVAVGQWVLVHAGFAITTVSESDAKETWDYLYAIDRAAALEAAGGDGVPSPGADHDR